ncbi:hypothetical protein FRX31_004751 [Thalictrum thalictroides]|uniref:Pentatricopeptide repeat-containing protein n=1 Tax=Thalictrum thalictroides TaxID=46969 RepID=A0A7J6X7A6_THATH|nr:hypothetical protein FRX31_004751 [Thalictrum thalictroides]
MISGFSLWDKGAKAFNYFKKMQLAGVTPTVKSVTSLLPVCSSMSATDMQSAIRSAIDADEFITTSFIGVYIHAGKVEKGLELIKTVIKDYGLNPTPEHFGCIVDLLSRTGQLDKAWHLLQEIQHPITSL